MLLRPRRRVLNSLLNGLNSLLNVMRTGVPTGICAAQGDMMGALASYTRALRLSPRDFKSLFNRGFMCARAPLLNMWFHRGFADIRRSAPRRYERIGKYNEAVKDFTAASALQPANSCVGAAGAAHVTQCNAQVTFSWVPGPPGLCTSTAA